MEGLAHIQHNASILFFDFFLQSAGQAQSMHFGMSDITLYDTETLLDFLPHCPSHNMTHHDHTSLCYSFSQSNVLFCVGHHTTENALKILLRNVTL